MVVARFVRGSKDTHASSDRCEVVESAWLLRPELAKHLIPEPEPVVTGTAKRGEVAGTQSDGDRCLGSQPTTARLCIQSHREVGRKVFDQRGGHRTVTELPHVV